MLPLPLIVAGKPRVTTAPCSLVMATLPVGTCCREEFSTARPELLPWQPIWPEASSAITAAITRAGPDQRASPQSRFPAVPTVRQLAMRGRIRLSAANRYT